VKIQCHSRELLDAITLVSAVVPSNPTRPVLQSVRMIASKSGLRIEGTDLEVGLSAQVDEVMVEIARLKSEVEANMVENTEGLD